MLEKDLTRDIKSRLNNIRGQMEGIVRMLDEDRDPELILNQFKAAGNALEIAHELLLDETYRSAKASRLQKVNFGQLPALHQVLCLQLEGL